MGSPTEKVEELLVFQEKLVLCKPVKANCMDLSGNETLAHLCKGSSPGAYRTRAWGRWLELKRN